VPRARPARLGRLWLAGDLGRGGHAGAGGGAASARLNDAIQNPGATRQFQDTGAEPVLRNPARMAEFVRRENAVWRPLLRELGIRLDG
jgi:hypothetical protein